MADKPWWSLDRYMDQRRHYLVRMADLVVIRSDFVGGEVVVKDRGGSQGVKEFRTIRFINEALVDTMAACGFGLGAR